MANATDRLWITQPKRVTALATVTAVRGAWFSLDRSLFAPTSQARRHPQPHDQGTVWWDGSKRNLVKVKDEDGTVWHLVAGARPPVGTQLNCHLDGDRRGKTSRAHTAMHLLLRALTLRRVPPLVADPEVKGGASFRLTFDGPIAPAVLAEALQQANAWVQANIPVERGHGLAIEAQLDAQRFEPDDPFPGGEPFTFVRIRGACCYPCDGTHVDRTAQIGRIVVKQAHASRGKFVVVGACIGP